VLRRDFGDALRVELHDSGSPSAPYAGGTYTFTVTRRLRAPARMTWGSRFSISTSDPGASLIVRLPIRAEPVPDTT